MISSGEVEVYLVNEVKETYLETLGQGSNFGMYTALQQDTLKFTIKAKSDWTIFKLPYSVLDKLRAEYDVLNVSLFELESMVEEDAAPFCDFRISRQYNPKAKTLG